MNKAGVVIAMILWVAVSANYMKDKLNTGNDVVTAFNQENFETVDTIIDAFGRYSDTYMEQEEKEKALITLASAMGLDMDYEIVTEGGNTSIVKQGENARTEIVMSTSTKDYGSYKSAAQYVAVKLTIYERCDCAMFYRDMVENIFEANQIDGYVNIILQGSTPGALNYYERNNLADNLLKRLDAEIVTQNRDSELFTVYAYTDKVDEYILSMGKKVNINISEEYDEKNNMTILYLSTPLNNLDY